MASDALPVSAYDGNESTYLLGGTINIDESVIGKQVAVKTNTSPGYSTSFYIYDELGNQIYSKSIANTNLSSPLFTIPEGAKKIVISGVKNKTRLYEISIFNN